MSITYFKLQENQIDFRVGVIGSRKWPYILNFCQSSMNITCTCPDFEKRQHKPLCKHMLFIVNLSNHQSMFNNLNSLDELKNTIKLSAIRNNLMSIIDSKKLNAELEESNIVSIERDDFCSICMCDLDVQIEKCSVCAHVMHISCIKGWWELSPRWNNIKGRCPYCKDPRGFSHINYNAEDPWKLFDFDAALEAVVQPVPELLLPAAEQAADQPVQELLPPAEEAVVQQVPELLLPAADQPIFDAVIGNPPWQIEIINQFRQTLSFIDRFRNLNLNNPYIQNLDSRLESLQQEHDAIQNAFQAQPE
jgi:Leucine-rich repeat (LRR) protein